MLDSWTDSQILTAMYQTLAFRQVRYAEQPTQKNLLRLQTIEDAIQLKESQIQETK